MSNILSEQKDHVFLITLNRVNKHNAFDDVIISELQSALDTAISDADSRVIILKAHGRHFSAGADLAWMQRMAGYSEEENITDAKNLAKLMHSFYSSPKPTIAMVQGAAMGGGAGLVAACDIAIASEKAQFCFSEVKLGLIPAVISPYVINAIGARSAQELFMSAQTFDAERALNLHLIQHCVSEEMLLSFTLDYAQKIASYPPGAVKAAKSLVQQVALKPINDGLLDLTARLIAKQRVSPEGQHGMNAFLKKGHHVS